MRTTPALVVAVLSPGGDYDAADNPDLTPFIAAANAMTTQCVADALNLKGFTITDTGAPTDLATQIETWLAAHFYCQSDKPLDNKSAGGASGKYQGSTGDGLAGTRYGLTAMRIDWSQCLRNLDNQQRATGQWLGKPPSAQIPYVQRN